MGSQPAASFANGLGPFDHLATLRRAAADNKRKLLLSDK
jgi:hypothetical protein